MSEKLVSVIIPTYNQNVRLKKALLSIINQTYKCLEIIVIDDNVDNETSKFVRDLIDNIKISNECISIRYQKNIKNSGSVFSRNEGIKLATGDFITFLDDDDIFTKEKVEKQLDKLIKNNANFSVCNIALTKNWKNYKVRNRNFLKNNESLLVLHQKYHIAGTSTFMFDKQTLIDLGGFTSQDYGDDYYLIEQAIKNSYKFIHADFVGVYASLDPSAGLSSWKNKIQTEKSLYDHKLSNLEGMKIRDVKYIKMRHYLVISKAYLNGKKIFKFIFYLIISVIQHPVGFIRIGIGLDI